MSNEVVDSICVAFDSYKNDDRAIQMSAYMKNRFDFFGIDSTTRKTIQKPFLSALKHSTQSEERWEIVYALFQKPQRELHYAAIDCINALPVSQYKTNDAIHLEHLLTTDSWWDSVDAIASNYLGKWMQQFPNEGKRLIDKWRASDSMWLHRSCLIFQLKYRSKTDINLLESCIEQFLPNSDFFIQKAIGWSLREVSKFNPERVEQLIEKHNITGLAKREASKYL